MIMQWKKVDNGFTAHWQRTDFTLFHNPVTDRWNMAASGKLVRQTWPTARAAMSTVENQQQALIQQALIQQAATELRRETSFYENGIRKTRMVGELVHATGA
jgi:hypothetical protein